MVATVNASTTAGVVITPDNSGALALQSSSATALYVDSSQNVGIGVSSSLTGKLSIGTVSYGQTSPVAQVNGASKAISNNGGIFSIGATDAAAADVGGSLGFTANSAGNGYATGQISGRKVNNSDYSSYMAFTTCNSGGTLSEAMRIDSAGNVGIGTNSPAANPKLNIKQANDTSDGGLLITASDGSGSGGIARLTDGSLQFRNAGASRMSISSGGVVSGTSGTGGSYILSFTNNSNGNNDSGFNITAGTSTTSTYIINAGNNSSASFRVYGNGTYGTVSDANRKKNVETARGYLQDLQQLRVVKYNWIEQENTTPKELGFIAQEVEQVFAGLVETDADNLKMIKQPVLIPMLVKAIQELKAINDTQAETINALTARIVALENR
jgi:hypothetical protein